MAAPEFVMTDFAKFGRPEQCHIGYLALHAYKNMHGNLPKPWCKVTDILLFNILV